MKRTALFFCAGLIFILQSAAQSVNFRYTVIPEEVRPGEPVTIGVTGNVTQAALYANNRQIGKAQFTSIPSEDGKPGFLAAILTIPSTVNSSLVIIRLENERGLVREITVAIKDREFRSETIRITPSLNRVLNEPHPDRAAQSNRLWGILTTTGSVYYHTGEFNPPVVSTRRTSVFGTRRVNAYPNGRTTTSIHEGVDYGVPTGTQVFACGAGMVVLAANRIVTGNSVIIEHGPGIYSVYYHLDKIEAQEGIIVDTGDLIGYSGSTGFSTGPHLHWDIRINTENTDPDVFLSRPLLDKNLIIKNLFYLPEP